MWKVENMDNLSVGKENITDYRNGSVNWYSIRLKLDNIGKLTLFNFFFSLVFLTPVIVFFYQSRGLNLTQIFLLESILIVVSLFLEIPTGVMADRYGRKIAIVLGGLFFLLEPIIFIFAQGFWPFALAAALYGVGTAFISGSIEAIIYEVLENKKQAREMTRFMGSFGAAGLMGAAIAPIVGSIIARNLTEISYLILIYLTIATGLIGWLFSLTLQKKGGEYRQGGNSIRYIFYSALKALKNNSTLRLLVLLEIITNPLIFIAVYLAQPYFITAQVKVSIFGIIFTGGLLLDALLRKYIYRLKRRFGLLETLFISLLMPGLLYIALAYVEHPVYIVLLFIILRGVAGLRLPLLAEYKNNLIVGMNRTTILSTIAMLVGIYEATAIFALGVLADWHIAFVFKILGLVVAGGAILFALSIKNMTRKKIGELV